jgi:hypothetical protein
MYPADPVFPIFMNVPLKIQVSTTKPYSSKEDLGQLKHKPHPMRRYPSLSII